MKNQYFGDINDYRKYGVLRILATHARVSVGICWLLTEDDRRGSGELRTYLSKPARWRSFEAQLYDRLQDLLKPDVPRQVTLAKDWGLIPNAVYFEEVLGGGEGQRTAYFARAHTVLAGCDLWFFDPDNGIEVDSVPTLVLITEIEDDPYQDDDLQITYQVTGDEARAGQLGVTSFGRREEIAVAE